MVVEVLESILRSGMMGIFLRQRAIPHPHPHPPSCPSPVEDIGYPSELSQSIKSLKRPRLQSARDDRGPPVWSQNLSVLLKCVRAPQSFCEQYTVAAQFPGHDCSRFSLESQHPEILFIKKHSVRTEPSTFSNRLNHLEISLSLLGNFVFLYIYIYIYFDPSLFPTFSL